MGGTGNTIKSHSTAAASIRHIANQPISHREQLREQHELTQEIGTAITSMPITEPVDEDELEADLAALEQEKLDDQMLSTGTTVPVADRIDRLPAAGNGERKSINESSIPSESESAQVHRHPSPA